MKIDAACIDHNAMEIIKNTVADLYDFVSMSECDSNWRVAMLGEIRGVCLLADKLKKELIE